MIQRFFVRVFYRSAAVGVCLALTAHAQRASDAVTPEVQRLYAEAREAQSHGDGPTAIARYSEILRLAPRQSAGL